MGERVIHTADISRIENNLSALANAISVVSENVDVVHNNVSVVHQELEDLARQFHEYVARDAAMKQLQLAESRVIKTKQKIAEDFGYYDEVRRHTTGILQASDISVVKKETMTQCTEELMLAAPRYWLAPSLISLAAWINDDKDLAERALKEAMRRDDEKTSLLFALISRRAGRYNGCLVWLERYFSMQDPFDMERKMVVVLDAFATGLFGPDSKGLCAEKIKGWLSELAAVPGFDEKQKDQWQVVLKGRVSTVNDNDYPYLSKNASNWDELKGVMSWAKTHNDIHNYFTGIFNAPPDNPNRLSDQIDALLDSLTTNYDNEELPLRRELRLNEIIIEEQGNLTRSKERFTSEEKAFDERVDFSQHLTNVAMNPKTFGALNASQKLAISLSKDWLLNAYEDLTVQSRSNVPIQIPFSIDDWNGMTSDGSNEKELTDLLNQHISQKLENELTNVKLEPIHWIALFGGGAIGLYGLATAGIFSIIIGACAIWYHFAEKKSIGSRKDDLIKKFQGYRENAQTVLRAFLAEVVDYRREYAKKDGEYSKVIDFIKYLSPNQYIGISDTNVRHVM